MKTTKNVIESGKAVMQSAIQERSANKAKRGGQSQQADTTPKTDFLASLYEHLQGIELQKEVTSVNVAALRKAASLEVLLAGIDKENEQAQSANRKALLNSFRGWYSEQMHGHDFAAFCATLRKRAYETRGFSLTFEDAVSNGAVQSHETRYTAAGLRISYNSVENLHGAVRREAKRQKAAKVLDAKQAARAAMLAAGMTAEQIALLGF